MNRCGLKPVQLNTLIQFQVPPGSLAAALRVRANSPLLLSPSSVGCFPSSHPSSLISAGLSHPPSLHCFITQTETFSFPLTSKQKAIFTSEKWSSFSEERMWRRSQCLTLWELLWSSRYPEYEQSSHRVNKLTFNLKYWDTLLFPSWGHIIELLPDY